MSAIGAAMRKLVHLCFGVLHSGKPYSPEWKTRLNLQDISNLSTKISIIPLIYLLTCETVSTATNLDGFGSTTRHMMETRTLLLCPKVSSCSVQPRNTSCKAFGNWTLQRILGRNATNPYLILRQRQRLQGSAARRRNASRRSRRRMLGVRPCERSAIENARAKLTARLSTPIDAMPAVAHQNAGFQRVGAQHANRCRD